MRENTEQNNSEYRHYSRSVCFDVYKFLRCLKDFQGMFMRESGRDNIPDGKDASFSL